MQGRLINSTREENTPSDNDMPRGSNTDSSESVHDTNQERPSSNALSRSGDLDKLSLCLSEVSSNADNSGNTSLFSDIVQAQLAFWTLIFSVLYTYAWQQHRKKFILSMVMVVPAVTLTCLTMAAMLTCIVVLGRVFSTPLRLDDVLKLHSNADDDQDNTSGVISASRSMLNLAGVSGIPMPSNMNSGNTAGVSGLTANGYRHRTFSGNRGAISTAITSGQSLTTRRFERSGGSGSQVRTLRSSSCEELALPTPTCRKHSSQYYSTYGIGSGKFYHQNGGCIHTSTGGISSPVSSASTTPSSLNIHTALASTASSPRATHTYNRNASVDETIPSPPANAADNTNRTGIQPTSTSVFDPENSPMKNK